MRKKKRSFKEEGNYLWNDESMGENVSGRMSRSCKGENNIFRRPQVPIRPNARG